METRWQRVTQSTFTNVRFAQLRRGSDFMRPKYWDGSGKEESGSGTTITAHRAQVGMGNSISIFRRAND